MNFAFEITSEDVATVLDMYEPHQIFSIDIDVTTIGDVFNLLHLDEVEHCALRANEMDEQTNCAYAEIESQLRSLGILSPHSNYWQKVAYGN